MILASLKHYEISDIYVGASPGRIRRLRDQVGELGWVPVPSPMDSYDDPDVNPIGWVSAGSAPIAKRCSRTAPRPSWVPLPSSGSALGPLRPAGV